MTNKEFRETQFKKQQKNNVEHIHPDYYKSEYGNVTFDDVVNAKWDKYELVSIAEFNVNKYIWRWRNKNGLSDLIKAHFYLTQLIDYVKQIEEEEENNEE